MEVWEKISDIGEKEWFKLALEHGRKFKSWTDIRMGTPHHYAWLDYFEDKLGWTPITLLKIAKNKEQSWTAPCAWPTDLSFVMRTERVVQREYPDRAKLEQTRFYQKLRDLLSREAAQAFLDANEFTP